MFETGLTIITTTHDLPGIAGRLPRVVAMGTTVIAEGPPPEVLTDAILLKTYGLLDNTNTNTNSNKINGGSADDKAAA